MPAEKAGLKAKDIIAAVDGHTFTYVASFVAYLQQMAGRPVDLTVSARRADSANYGQAGARGQRQGARQLPDRIRLPAARLIRLSNLRCRRRHAARRSSTCITPATSSRYLRKLFTRRSEVQNLSGPIGIARETGEAISMPGWQPIIGLMALISLNLGIFNLLADSHPRRRDDSVAAGRGRHFAVI